MPGDKNQEWVRAGQKQLKIKRKWQIALRRYLLEGNPAVLYAPYFGLPSSNFKEWISSQFQNGMNWENFGSRWNLTQRVPTSLFDLTEENHLRLCWHFTNIVAQDIQDERVDSATLLLSARSFFQGLEKISRLKVPRSMISHLNHHDTINTDNGTLTAFIQEKFELLQTLQSFDADDYSRLNKGETLRELMSEKDILKKYGS